MRDATYSGLFVNHNGRPYLEEGIRGFSSLESAHAALAGITYPKDMVIIKIGSSDRGQAPVYDFYPQGALLPQGAYILGTRHLRIQERTAK